MKDKGKKDEAGMDQIIRQRYEKWLAEPGLDEETRRELETIRSNPGEIEDRFFKELEFGTAGLRGIMGAGTNRMNRYMVRKVTKGLADCIAAEGVQAKARGVVIAYDNRRMSKEFCLEAAMVLAGQGIKVFYFEGLRPTPQLSYTLRKLGCQAGIVITASHNPREYNGYKVYWEDGAQICKEQADAIYRAVSRVENPLRIEVLDLEKAWEKGLVEVLTPAMDRAYRQEVKGQSLRTDVIQKVGDNMKVVYTPLHGTGGVAVPQVLREAGFKRVLVVPRQDRPDPDFSTVTYPNPEDPQAFTLALELARKEEAELVLATDPDCDRVGAAVRDEKGIYQMLTGNQIGALLVQYILKGRKDKGYLPENGVIIKTVVTGEMGAAIAKSYGVETVNTLTGFKYIGEKIKEYELSGEKTFLFGYEESNGYLSGSYARDKDAVAASLLLCEAAAWYHLQGMSLLEGLKELYAHYGYYREELKSVTLEGHEGPGKIDRILDYFRSNCPECMEGRKVLYLEDYLAGERIPVAGTKEKEKMSYPKTKMLKFILENEGWLALRPSGTEPKFKIYAGVREDSWEEGQRLLDGLIGWAKKKMKGF